MSYARLTFSTSNPPAGQVLKAIAKVLTGESNIANLEGVGTSYFTSDAGVTISEIVGNTAADSWTLVYPASLPGAGNNQVATFTVSAPCVTETKNKYVRFIGATSAGVFTEPIYSAGTVYSSTVSYSIYAQGLSAIDGSGNCTNLTWRNSNGTQATVVKGTSTTELYSIEMSWSRRHLLVVSSISNNCYFAAMEFPESAITSKYANCAPVLYMTGPATSTLSSLTVNSTAAAHVHNIVNTLNPVNSTWQGSRALVPTTSPPAAILSSSFTLDLYKYKEYTSVIGTFNIVPLVHDDIGYGNGYLDLTTLSNVFIAPSDSTQDKYTGSNGVTYKAIKIYNNNGTSLTKLMVKYG